jgi:hypothetical protein
MSGHRQTLGTSRDTASVAPSELPSVLHEDQFWPAEPGALEDCGLPESLIESMICQNLMAQGTLSGRKLGELLGLPFGIVDQQLSALRTRQLVAHARSAPLNDYYYALTENGQRRTLLLQRTLTYTGIAPVPLSDYLLSVEAQANQYTPVGREQLLEALAGISYEPTWLEFLGPAVNSNAGIFLYGPPGNGKTTVAKCMTALRGESVWIPYAIIDDGVVIKLFDAAYHRRSELNQEASLVNLQNYDRRWIRIQRPTVVVGGELTMDNLEIRHDPRTNTCEAPLQLKSNCGSLLIDDFGRQRIAPEDLLNRWIVPLENKMDFLTLPTGKKICVPFEQIVLFSTNLQPHDLVDEAFLRRVPFKIEIRDPKEEEFAKLFENECALMGFPWRPEVIGQLVHHFFRANQMPLRRCYARDLLAQVRAYCTYRSEPLDLRTDYLQHACRNYFGSLGKFDSQGGRSPRSSMGSIKMQPAAPRTPTQPNSAGQATQASMAVTAPTAVEPIAAVAPTGNSPLSTANPLNATRPPTDLTQFISVDA